MIRKYAAVKCLSCGYICPSTMPCICGDNSKFQIGIAYEKICSCSECRKEKSRSIEFKHIPGINFTDIEEGIKRGEYE